MKARRGAPFDESLAWGRSRDSNPDALRAAQIEDFRYSRSHAFSSVLECTVRFRTGLDRKCGLSLVHSCQGWGHGSYQPQTIAAAIASGNTDKAG